MPHQRFFHHLRVPETCRQARDLWNLAPNLPHHRLPWCKWRRSLHARASFECLLTLDLRLLHSQASLCTVYCHLEPTSFCLMLYALIQRETEGANQATPAACSRTSRVQDTGAKWAWKQWLRWATSPLCQPHCFSLSYLRELSDSKSRSRRSRKCKWASLQSTRTWQTSDQTVNSNGKI